MRSIQKGDIIKTRIDSISSSGNGLITEVNGKRLDGHINIGPVKPDCRGTIVEIEKIHHGFGRCITIDVRQGNYESKLKDLIPDKVGNDVLSSVPVKKHGNTWECPECGHHLITNSDIWDCRRCSYCHIPVQYIYETVDTNKNDNKRTTDNGRDNISDSDSNNSGNTTQPNQEQLKKGRISESDLISLRNEAKTSGSQDIPERQTTTTTQTRQYHRSTKVREYVLARADGVCEGCGNPAPFQSKTGGPYLHAHHINELSDGGSDTPKTVAALCPNCHYEIHHGIDGDKYNEEIAETIEQKEQN